IPPNNRPLNDDGEAQVSTEEEQKLVRKALISAYDKHIAAKLKDELCCSSITQSSHFHKKVQCPSRNDHHECTASHQ
ncbi:hypothetical protein FRX31_035107, partial [Thalictrum thalictroides]